MARYINEDEFVAWVKEHWCADCQNDNGLRCRACWIDDAIDIVEEAPEADVAPKSEVEELKDWVEAYKNTIASMERIDEELRTKLKNAKTEVARELLSDLKKTVHDKAVYSYSKEMYPYINLKVFDAILRDYLNKLEKR